MGFFVTNSQGGMRRDPTTEVLDAVLAEMDDLSDDEHGDVSLTHDSGWCLTVFPSGRIVWENVEHGEPRHALASDRGIARDFWLSLAAGDIAAIESASWSPGYR